MKGAIGKITLAAVVASAGACTPYVTPGGPADLGLLSERQQHAALAAPKGGGEREEMSPQWLRDAATVKPAVKFPAALLVARVQESGYRNRYLEGIDAGGYSIITTREVETEDDMARISRLRGVSEVGSLNRLLVQARRSDATALREAAARLHADLLLVYTFSTSSHDRNNLPLLSVITLGLAPTQSYRVTSTISAIVLDVKTGYVYGAIEQSGKHEGLTIAWNTGSALEAGRRKVEREVFEKLLTELDSFWGRFYERYQRNAG